MAKLTSHFQSLLKSFHWLILLISNLHCTSGMLLKQRGLETNEIIEQFVDKDARRPVLHECHRNDVCAYLQANVKGINVQMRCRCPKPFSCITTWDPLDGHSITQGSDQYKFCDAAPKVPVCSENDVAHHVTAIISTVTYDVIKTHTRIHCKCPDLHSYRPKTTDSPVSYLNDRYEIWEINSVCVPLPPCTEDEPCKVITENNEDFLVNPKCLCPESFSCPSLSEPYSSHFQGRGVVRDVHCQIN